MLQRIQSIYLLLASLALFSMFFFPFVHNFYINGKPDEINIMGVHDAAGVYTQHFTELSAADVVIALLPLGVIFLFKNRKQQIALGWSCILVIIGFSFWVSQTVKSVMGSTEIDMHNASIGLLLSTISILLIILAVNAVKRDEKLVKSADRLR